MRDYLSVQRDRRTEGSEVRCLSLWIHWGYPQWIYRFAQLGSHSRYILALLGVSAFALGSQEPRQVLNASPSFANGVRLSFSLRYRSPSASLITPRKSRCQRSPLSAERQPSLSLLSCRTAWFRALFFSFLRCSWCSRS